MFRGTVGNRREVRNTRNAPVFVMRADGGQGPCAFDDTVDETCGATHNC